MRLIDADRLYPDRKTDKGLAISLDQIANAPTVKEAKALEQLEQIKQIINSPMYSVDDFVSGLKKW